MAVMDPLKVTITNFNEVKTLEAPDFPAVKDSKTHKIPISSVVYIEREDFSEKTVKEFHRLTPDQPVGLKYFAEGNIAFKDAVKDQSGKVIEIKAELVPKDVKVKAHIQWVAQPAPGVVIISPFFFFLDHLNLIFLHS